MTTVTGFTGSPVWHLLYPFPPNDFDEIERAYEGVAERFDPILDVFEQEGVHFALEVHPTEIVYDFVTTPKLLDALARRGSFGINLDPIHFAHQFLDTAEFTIEFADRICHVHVKDSKKTVARASSRPATATSTSRRSSARSTRPATPGRSRCGKTPASTRECGAQDALAFVRRTDFAPSAVSFHKAMQRNP